jgi:quinol monooxygenase YgiN
MLIRIVRMSFQADKINDFLDIYNPSHMHISNFPGCMHVELLQDADFSNVICTDSHWLNEEALEKYFQFALFKGIWPQAKILFATQPLAFSLHRITE